jgi:hypothetical protein
MTMTFQEFMTACDGVVSAKIGLGVYDLPDAAWRDYYEDEMSPEGACECAVVDYWIDEMPSLEDVWFN